MKSLLLALLIPALLIPALATATEWTHKFEQGEDASSTIYHYYHITKEGQTTRIRSIWNGGAQRPPEITDYILGDTLTIRQYTGERKDIPALIAGKDAQLKLTEEFKFDGSIFTAPDEKPNLTSIQLGYLNNLIYLLSQERQPIKKTTK